MKKQAVTRFAAGLGTADYPYVVKTEVQFNSIKQHSDEHFVLKANLDYSNLAAGTIKKFTGSFDGNGYTISNCTIDTTLYSGGTGTAGCVGLFGEVTGTVRNLRVWKIYASMRRTTSKGTSRNAYETVCRRHRRIRQRRQPALLHRFE